MEFAKALGDALVATHAADADTKSLAKAADDVAKLSTHEQFAAAAAVLIQSNLDKPLSAAAAAALKNAATLPHVRSWLEQHLFPLVNQCGDTSPAVKKTLLECAAVLSRKFGWPQLVKQLADRLTESKSIADIACAMDVIQALHGDDRALAMLSPALYSVFSKCARSWSEAKEKKDSDTVAKILLAAVTTLIESQPLVAHVRAEELKQQMWSKMLPLALKHSKSETLTAMQSALWRAITAVADIKKEQAGMCLEHALTATTAHADIMMWLASFAPEQVDMFRHVPHQPAAATAAAETKMETKSVKRKGSRRERTAATKRARGMGLGGEKAAAVVMEEEEDDDDSGDDKHDGPRLLDMVFRKLIAEAMLTTPEEYQLFRDDPVRFVDLELNPSTDAAKQFLHGHPISKRMAAQHLCAVLFRDHGERMLQLVRRFVQHLCSKETAAVDFMQTEVTCALMYTIPTWDPCLDDFIDMRVLPLIEDCDIWGPSLPRAFCMTRLLRLLIKWADDKKVPAELPRQLCTAVTAIGDRAAASMCGILLDRWMSRLGAEDVGRVIDMCHSNINDERQQNDHVARLLVKALDTVDSKWFGDKDRFEKFVADLIQAINVVRVREPYGCAIAMYPHWLVSALSVLLARTDLARQELVTTLALAMLNPDCRGEYGVYAFHILSIVLSRHIEVEMTSPLCADMYSECLAVWSNAEERPEFRLAACRLLAQFIRRLPTYLNRGEQRVAALSKAVVARLQKHDPQATTLAALMVLHFPPARLSKLLPDLMKLHVHNVLETKESRAVGHATAFTLASMQRLKLAGGDFYQLCDGLGKDMLTLIWTKMVTPCMQGEFKIDPQHAPLVVSALKQMTTEEEWKAARQFMVATADVIKSALASASAAPLPTETTPGLPHAPAMFG